MTDALQVLSVPHPRGPRAQLLAAHERRAAVRALAAHATDAVDCALLLEVLDLDAADGRAVLPPVGPGPVLSAPPPPAAPIDLRPVGLRHLSAVTGPISPPRTPRPRTAGAPRASRPVEQAPADGLCPVEDCPRPWRHRGIHTKPKPAPRTAAAARTPAPAASPRPPAAPRAAAPRRSPGRPPTPLDTAEAARRYEAGEALFDLARDMHVGVRRIRQALAEHGVPTRGRGHVLGQRGPLPRPIDEEQCIALYVGGLDTHLVARQLGVKQARVRDVLRAAGVLKRRPGTTVPLDVTAARRLYATGLSVGAVAKHLSVRTRRVADVLREHDELRARGPVRR